MGEGKAQGMFTCESEAALRGIGCPLHADGVQSAQDEAVHGRPRDGAVQHNVVLGQHRGVAHARTPMCILH
jgi:hypothetical protein